MELRIPQLSTHLLLHLLLLPLLLLGLAYPGFCAPIPEPEADPDPARGGRINFSALGRKRYGANANSGKLNAGKILGASEPLVYEVAATLLHMPVTPPPDNIRILESQANTESKVDQNGLPWARPPPPMSNQAVEAMLDERHYQRLESMIKSGDLIYDPKTRKIYHADTLLPLDIERVYNGLDMLHISGTDWESGDGMTPYQHWENGDLKIQQQIYGQPVPFEETNEYRIRKAYGMTLPEKEPVQKGELSEYERWLRDNQQPRQGSGPVPQQPPPRQQQKQQQYQQPTQQQKQYHKPPPQQQQQQQQQQAGQPPKLKEPSELQNDPLWMEAYNWYCQQLYADPSKQSTQ